MINDQCLLNGFTSDPILPYPSACPDHSNVGSLFLNSATTPTEKQDISIIPESVPLCSPQPPIRGGCCSAMMAQLHFLWIPCWRGPRVCSLCSASFTCHGVLEVCPCCSTHNIPSYTQSNTQVCGQPTFCLSIHLLRTSGLFPLFGMTNKASWTSTHQDSCGRVSGFSWVTRVRKWSRRVVWWAYRACQTVFQGEGHFTLPRATRQSWLIHILPTPVQI